MSLRLYLTVIALISYLSIQAQVKLPQLIRDSMVLQRDAKINVWGWATKGEKVSIRFDNKIYRTTTGNDGKWKLQLSPMQAGGPYTMYISGKNKIVLQDILIGDVWLCSGQSNMVHQMRLHSNVYAAEIAKANYPAIRHFWISNFTNTQGPQDDLPGGSWKWANPTNINEFSAVAYFFAKKIYEKYQVPVGLINASWGGTPIEAWTSEDGLKAFPGIAKTVEKNKDTAYVNGVNRKATEQNAKLVKQEDKGITQKWYAPAYIPKGWRQISIPGYWEDQGIRDLDGTVWYRREIEVPGFINAPAKVFLGRIVDADELYINGVKIGTTGYMYPQRRYIIPDGTLKAGKNLFVIRVSNNSGKGGFVPGKPYQLIAGNDTIDLTGYWNYKVGQVNRQGTAVPGIAIHYQPTALYNAMLAPVINYSIKGFAWYQGESNTGQPEAYAKLQPAMIDDWRKKWGMGEIPFLFVQLPGFMDFNYSPAESQWAAFREAQSKSLSIPNTAMVVAIDLGEWNDIHPDRKKEVGERLALAAMKIAYKENIVYSGPVYQSSVVDGNKIIISFSNAGSGLTTNDDEAPGEFAIAGADGKFVWANAKIEGDKVTLSSDEISAPKYARYAWADNPVNPNLVNKEGLPAAPFRTDTLPIARMK